MISHTCLVASIGLALGGCQTAVELQYSKAPKAGEFSSSESLAKDHYEYVELSSMYLKVAPADASSGKTGDKSASTPSEKSAPAQGDGKTDGAAARTDSAGNAKKPTPAEKKNAKKDTTAGDAKKTDEQPAGSGKANAGAGTGQFSKGTLDPALATTLIDGKKWVATVVPVPDGTHGFMVRGVAGLWKVTTIGISRYDNSDVTSSVSIKAENLVAKRLGQFAGAAASMVQILGAVGVKSAVPLQPLLPFSIRVPASRDIGDLNDGWTYRFSYDSEDLPAGTVSFDQFMGGVASKKVGYWPVSACRSATLTVFPPSPDAAKYHYDFNVVVSSPEAVRLQPLPLDGKVSLGAVCGASETGTATADPVQTLSDDFTALQQGIKKVKDARKGSGGASSGAGSSTSDAGSNKSGDTKTPKK